MRNEWQLVYMDASWCREACTIVVARIAALLLLIVIAGSATMAQTSGTGALAGTVTDSSGGVISGAQIKVTSVATGESRLVSSGPSGNYFVGLLPPGQYNVEVARSGFKTAAVSSTHVSVTDTVPLNVRLEVGAVTQTVTVAAGSEQLQAETSAIGRVTGGEQVQDLPLVTRNYTQIIALNPGVNSDVWNSAALGNGGSGVAANALLVVNGGTAADNNYQMDGVGINDLGSNGSGSGGVAVPNPDTIQEFKVQTGQYDASYGRNAGANVDVITKGGTNNFHGAAWEFFRNNIFDANTFFGNQEGQPTPVLKQNEFGGDLGGPIKKDKLLFFVSYEGTRQRNGVDPHCSSTVTEAPLTNNRSAAALGALFAGQSGANGGTAILADGSNISPVALALLQFKLPNGQYMIPTPQTVDPALPFDSQGRSALSIPCPYTDDQFMANSDYQISANDKLSARFFFSNSAYTYTLPNPTLTGAPVPGFPLSYPSNYRNFSLTYTHVFSSTLLNEAKVGFHRTYVPSSQSYAFSYSQVGATVPSFANDIPLISLDFPSSNGLELGGNGQQVTITQNTYDFEDSLSWVKGRHSFRFGGGLSRMQDNNEHFHFIAGLGYLSWADFLLGESAAQNGTPFSNVFLSVESPGLFDRAFRALDADAYIQDDFKVTNRLTLNLGFRYDRLGDIGDALGRNATLIPSLLNTNPPPGGSLEGVQVPANYSGPIPPGVTRGSNDLAMNGNGQNTWNPRFGFAWQLPHTDRVVLRGGYGIYHTRYTGQPLAQLLSAPPFATFIQPVATGNAAATNEIPFGLDVPTFPAFLPYSPTTSNNQSFFAPAFRAPLEHEYSLGLQTQLTPTMVFEVGYSGTRGLHELFTHSINQAGIASPGEPIRGQTTNTLANLPLRVPYEGWAPMGLDEIDSSGESWYNALLVSLNKKFGHGLQAQLSYTFSKDLADAFLMSTLSNGGVVLGNQNNPRQSYGPDFYTRPQRFVANYIYELPGPKELTSLRGELLGGWSLSGVVTIQAGHFMTVTYENGPSVYGIVNDRASLSGTCTPGQYAVSGGVSSHLNDYINPSCFTAPAVFSADDPAALGFGNSGIGILQGPGQNNWDMAIIKRFPLRWPREDASLEFRSEFFNAFNHPQFADPNPNFGTPTFGQITNTSVAPRLMQFALKLNF